MLAGILFDFQNPFLLQTNFGRPVSSLCVQQIWIKCRCGVKDLALSPGLHRLL